MFFYKSEKNMFFCVFYLQSNVLTSTINTGSELN